MISKNKNLFLKIYILFVIIISIALIILQILGSKNGVGYLTDFNLNVNSTLELNNLQNIRKNFITNYFELDEESVINYLLTNQNITNYVYHFRIRYYDKTFRNNDIYGVYPDLSNLPDYMKNAEMEEGGSPYGNFISDKKEINEDKIDNINYVLKIKYDIICITLIFSLLVISFIRSLENKLFINDKITIILTAICLLFFIIFTIYNIQLLFIILADIILILLGFVLLKKLKLDYNIYYNLYIFITIFLLNIYISNIIDYMNSYKFIIFFIISLIFSLFFFIFYLFCEKKNIKIENIFLVSFILIGLAYFILLPYLQVPDEGSHFYRAFEISNGYFISDRNTNSFLYSDIMLEVPSTYSDILKNLKKDTLINKDMPLSFFTGSSVYSFISYIPQSIGIFFGKLFVNNILLLAYFGRFFNFIFSIAVFYFSIKYVPIKKISLYLIVFFPMSLQEAISLAPDSIVTSCSALLISLCLNIKYREENNYITLREIILIYSLIIFISGSKIVYLPICFIILLIPKSKFKYSKLASIFPIFIICVLISIIWLYISSTFLPYTTSSKQQLYFILNNPFNYFYIFIYTIYKNFEFYISSMIGRDLSWFSIRIPNIPYYIFLYLPILLLLFDNNENNKRIDTKIKIILFIIIFIVIGLIFTALYIQWTKVGNCEIQGVQGRYFLPILFYIFMLFSNNKLKINFEYIRMHIFIILSMSNLLVLYKIFKTLSIK